MLFLCLCRYNADDFSGLDSAQFDRIGEMCAPLDQAFKASGHVRIMGSLGLPEEARWLKATAGGVQEGEGLYEPTPEPPGAFFMIEAGSMEEALAVARMHPGAHLGGMFEGAIEIWPIAQWEQP
ncbi:MAG: YciI family protein [Beijerinckiaceae bacterium]|nr:YciI family protein [Beijerinckiaceae bacterium]